MSLCFKDSRKTINKYIPEVYRTLAMWCIALLINTSTWDTFIHNWRLICTVFLQLHLGRDDVSKEDQDALLDRIRKIESDHTTSNAVKASESLREPDGTDSSHQDVYDFDDSDDDVNARPLEQKSKSNKRKVCQNSLKEFFTNTISDPLCTTRTVNCLSFECFSSKRFLRDTACIAL
jgi:hypothetical protein